MGNQPNGNAKQAEQQTALATTSEKFVAQVERQFAAEMGAELAFTDYERTLAQHLFLKVDVQLKALEAKRLDSNKTGTPITWENVNLPKLALDGVHRISLGLDALIPNHVHPIPYYNKRIQKYDLDLRVGYVGKDLMARRLALEPTVDIIYELVYETDTFKPIMRSRGNEVEGYEFEINQPFSRGKVIGGFGYVVYDDPRKNRLVIITERDFQRAKQGAQTQDFWGANKFEPEMQFKTLVHRVTSKIPLDPRKVNAKSYAFIESQEAEADIEREAAEHANGEVIDIQATTRDDSPSEPAVAGAQTEPSPEPVGAASTNGHASQATLGPGF